MTYWKKWQDWMNAPFMGGSVSFWVATGLVAFEIFRVFLR